MLQEILKVHQAGDLDAAESQYREWLAFNPDDPEALHLLAALRRQRNDLGEALELAQRAVALAPGRANLHNTLGGFLLHANQFAAARDTFATALRLDPNQFGAALGLAQAAVMLGDFDSARDALAKADRLAPGHPRVLVQKAALAQIRGDHQTAVKLYLEANQRDSRDPAIHANLGRSLDVLGQTTFAEQALRNALEIKPDYTAARVTLGQVLVKAGRPDEGLAEYERVLADRPDHPMALAGRGDAMRLKGDLAGAVAGYRAAYAIAPDMPGLANPLIEALLLSGASDEAQALLVEALQRTPRDPDLRRTSVTIAARAGDTPYRQAIQQWLDVDPGNLAARTHLAHYLELRGEYPQADAVAREALALESRAGFARLILARSALRGGDPEQAQEQLNLVPPSSLQAVQRADRAQLRGLARDMLGDWSGAVEAWIESHQQTDGEAPLVLMPQTSEQIAALPVEGNKDSDPSPVFLLGLPGAGTESLAALLGQCGVRVLSDRFRPGGRADAVSTGQFAGIAARAARDASATAEFRDDYLLQLSTIDESVRSDLVDWLPFADLRAIDLLRAAFPAARFLVIQRDPRDCLLNWLALGSRQHLAGSDLAAMGVWLARAAEHLAEACKRIDADQLLLNNGSELGDANAISQRLIGFLGLGDRQRQETFNVLAGRGGLPTALPEGRWRSYQSALAQAFAPLS